MADIDSLDLKLTRVLMHLEHIEKHLNIPVLTNSGASTRRRKQSETLTEAVDTEPLIVDDAEIDRKLIEAAIRMGMEPLKKCTDK